jgi:predicted negative regulator of RcsB-dependent stress response
LIQIVKLRLADAQLAQNKYDEALKTLSGDVDPAFKATVEELRGDIFVARKILILRKSVSSAWDSLLNVNKNDKFYKLNSKVLAF